MIKLYDLIPHAEKAADTLGHLFKFVSLFQNAIDRIESQVKAYFTHNPLNAVPENLSRIASNRNIERYSSMSVEDTRFYLFNSPFLFSEKGRERVICFLFMMVTGISVTFEYAFAKSFDVANDLSSFSYDPKNTFENAMINTVNDCSAYSYCEDYEETTATAEFGTQPTEKQLDLIRYMWQRFMPPIKLEAK
jgi:site-specific DNA-adenine methylase